MTRKTEFKRGGTPRNIHGFRPGLNHIYLGYDKDYDVWVNPQETTTFHGRTTHIFIYIPESTHDTSIRVKHISYEYSYDLIELLDYLESLFTTNLPIKRFVL